MEKITFRELRLRHSTQKESRLFVKKVADMCGRSRFTVNQWSKPKRRQTPEKIIRDIIGRAFKCDPDYLFPEIETNKKK